MATLKNYKRVDRLDDFSEQCFNFAEGGSVSGFEFNRIEDAGAIDALWKSDIEDMIDQGLLGPAVAKWPPPNDAERAKILEDVKQLQKVEEARKASTVETKLSRIPSQRPR